MPFFSLFRLTINLERLEADASRNSRESLTPPSLKAAYKINHDNDEDSGDWKDFFSFNLDNLVELLADIQRNPCGLNIV